MRIFDGEREEDDAWAHMNRGVAYGEQGKPDAAITEYKEAIRFDPDDADYHTKLGVAYVGQGKLDAAIAEYREAIRLDPDLKEYLET
jgi:tetratricopeptide (TPR) repeat protein